MIEPFRSESNGSADILTQCAAFGYDMSPARRMSSIRVLLLIEDNLNFLRSKSAQPHRISSLFSRRVTTHYLRAIRNYRWMKKGNGTLQTMNEKFSCSFRYLLIVHLENIVPTQQLSKLSKRKYDEKQWMKKSKNSYTVVSYASFLLLFTRFDAASVLNNMLKKCASWFNMTMSTSATVVIKWSAFL